MSYRPAFGDRSELFIASYDGECDRCSAPIDAALSLIGYVTDGELVCEDCYRNET